MEAFWTIVVFAYVAGVLAVVGYALARMFTGPHRHLH
jgi:hypothetical protein